MVGIDKVYQRVLALANKEQGGYITPQDFNLFAEHAQLEIIDQYFYDLNQFSRLQANNNEYADMTNFIEEKIGYLSKDGDIGTDGTIPSDLYKLGVVYTTNGGVVEQVSVKEYVAVNALHLTKPTDNNPIYYWQNGKVISNAGAVSCDYIKKPTSPKWGYVVIGEKPLYSSNTSYNFVLHPSEEPQLVYRILLLAGISIQKPQLTQLAAGIQSANIQQEKQ